MSGDPSPFKSPTTGLDSDRSGASTGQPGQVDVCRRPLLAGIGGKMIYEGFKIPEVERKLNDPSNLIILLALSIATSIDALAVGFTLTLVTDYIFRAVATIGAVTFIISYAGYQLGKRFGHFFENKIEILGGIILIAIGAKILITSLVSNTH